MSELPADSEKPSDTRHRCRRTRAMVSTKVGDSLSYQAAVRWVMGCCFCNAWAARVVQEKRPSRAGVVRAMAKSDHWRWVSTPQVGAHLLKGDFSARGGPARDKPFQEKSTDTWRQNVSTDATGSSASTLP